MEISFVDDRFHGELSDLIKAYEKIELILFTRKYGMVVFKLPIQLKL